MKVKVKGLVFAGLAAVIFAGNAHAALQPGDLDTTVNPTHVTAKSYVDRVVNSTAGTLNDLTTTQKGNLVAAINEVNTAASNAASGTTTAINALDYTGAEGDGVVTQVTQENGQVAATKQKITSSHIADNAAIAATQLASGVQTTLTQVGTNTTNIGTLNNLDTTDKTNLVAAINEVNTAASNAATAGQPKSDDTLVAGTLNGNWVSIDAEDETANTCDSTHPCVWVNNVWTPIQQ